MSNIDQYSTIAPSTRSVLKEVASSRSIRLGELMKKAQPEIERATVESSLQELKNLHFIDERSSVLNDFRTFFITAEGIEATRKLAP